MDDYFNSEEEGKNTNIENKNLGQADLSYLQIFKRPSFQDFRTGRKDSLSLNKNEKNNNKVYQIENKETKIKQNTKIRSTASSSLNTEYDYPVNIFKKIFFSWTKKVLKAGNTYNQLELSHLGKFDPSLYPDNFLLEIKQQWEEMSKKTKSSPLIKALIKGNIKRLFLVFFGSLAVAVFDSFNVMLYSQVVNHLDKDQQYTPMFSLFTCMSLLLINYFIYTIIFRSNETYTAIFSYKLISQLDVLLYDKLLKISAFSNVSEGSLVNFIQSDAETFGEFFTYTPATLVLPFQILFFIYVLFTYFGFTFIFGIITLILIFLIFASLQNIRAKYQKEILSKKDRRMSTTTQAFEMIKIIKLYSWEDYFLNKIRQEREEELDYFKKAQIVSLFIDSITWSIGPILSFVSVFSYNLFNEPMEMSKLLTSLYIFHNLTDPLFLIPEYVNGLMDSLLSLRRLEAFLFCKEYQPLQMINNKYTNINSIENINNKSNRKTSFGSNLSFKSNNNENSNKKNNKINDIILEVKEEHETFEYNYFNEITELIDRKVVIDIDNIDFGIIKREEEFMVIEEDDDEEDEDDNDKNEESSDSETELEDIDETKLNIKYKKEKLLHHVTKENIKPKKIKKNKKEKIKGTIIVPLLKDIKLEIKQGDLIGIIGEFGSGKTCLFNAILNNLDILNGPNKKIIINGSIAYIPQKPWILNDTMRNNILFNTPYDKQKYDKIVNICQLEPDFELLKLGDMTTISDKGDNLSGGQKSRLNIARAVYNEADIYLFDDPFSALDAFVGKNIFDNVIKKYLKGKTILVITHALQYLPMMDYVIKMNEGKIEYYGNVKDAENQKFYEEFVNANKSQNFMESIDNYMKTKKKKKKKNEFESDYTESDRFLEQIKIHKKKPIEKKKYKYKYHKSSKYEILKIVFSHSGGWCIFFAIIFFNIFWKISDSGSDFIITYWSTSPKEQTNKLFTYYLLTKIISIVFIFVKSFIIVYALISFNRNIHETLIYRLFRAPVNLFHNLVTKSHIINRFSKDISNSVKYFWSLNSSLVVLFHIINGILISALLFWQVIFIIPILVFLDIYLYNYYIKCGQSLNVLETYTRVPILSGVKETLSGITSIRAYESKDIFQNIYHKRIHNFYKVLVYQAGCSSWFALNIDLVSFCFLFCILIFIWLFKNTIGGGVLGIVLNYVLKLIEHSYNFFSHFNVNERMSTSMESLEAYTSIVQEAPLELESDKMLIESNFPKSGKIEFVNYSVRYRPDTKIVLKNINILIQPGEKVGIVGRTGSGKSTLTLCLFRILEATNGKILIDDIDISLIGLSLLRSIITVIPQDPTLIEGSLRENLDPVGKFSDESMIECLKSLDIDYLLEEEGLNFMVKENGDNLSAGERQLICMARAMIRKSKIIVMDEATSSIDYNTEQLIQKAILTLLKNSTVITIAHRIKTILEYDKILVFEQGQLVEQGSPKELIENKKGQFYGLYTQSHM